MIEVPVYSQDGRQIETLQIDEEQLGGSVRPRLLKQAIVMYQANRRQGTVAKKSRGQVEGSTRKIYKQKHTGNARMGTVRQPLRRGGGRAFQQVPRDYSKDMPRKMRRLARANALLAKLLDRQVKVVDGLSFEGPKTKQFAQVLKALQIDGATCFLATARHDEALYRSGRNVPGMTISTVSQADAYNLLRHRFVVFTREAFLAFAADPMNPAAALQQEQAVA
jgi:large subunit ribosomal protein L4